jgi:hypothetical protein
VVDKAGMENDTPPPPAKGFRLKLACVLLGVLLAVVFAAYALFGYDYSEGSRSGYIRKFSRKGVIFKTYEGEIDKRLAGGSYDERDIFQFSVRDPKVAARIEQAEKTGKWVTLKYHQKIMRMPTRGDTEFFIEDVTISGAEATLKR